MPEDIEHLRDVDPQKHQRVRVTLTTAEGGREIPTPGNSVTIVAASCPTAQLSVMLNEVRNKPLTLKLGGKIRGSFYKLYIAHDAQAGEWVDVVIGNNDFQLIDENPIETVAALLTGGLGTQINKDAHAINTTTIIHTVTAGKLFLLFTWCLTAQAKAGTGSILVRDTADVEDYHLLHAASTVQAAGNISQQSVAPIVIPALYDIVVISDTAGFQVTGNVHGIEI